LKIETKSLDEIAPYENNPRFNQKAVEKVAKSIQEFGFRQPIVVDKTGIIIVGHTRYLAAKELGLETVPVHIADLSDEKAKAYRIADNKTGEIAEWDFEKLEIEINALENEGLDLEITGFTVEEFERGRKEQIRNGRIPPDVQPEPIDPPTTKRGQLFKLGNHRLLCGDSSDMDQIYALFDGADADMVNTDPPYGVAVKSRSALAIASGNSYSKTLDGAGVHRTKMIAKDMALHGDDIKGEAYDEIVDVWFRNIASILRSGAAFYIWGGYTNLHRYPMYLKKNKLRFQSIITWRKLFPVLTRRDFMSDCEFAFYGWKEGAAHKFFGAFNIIDCFETAEEDKPDVEVIELGPEKHIAVFDFDPRDKIPSDYWIVKKVAQSKMIHLTEKPVELAVRAIQYSSRPGWVVFDPFAGSGSTLIGCEQTGRCCYCIEYEPAYCDLIIKRWEEFTGETAEMVAEFEPLRDQDQDQNEE